MNIKHWFTGVVEDIADPLSAGRVRVRCFDYHNADHKELPTQDLPWASIVMPPNSAGVYGVGSSPVGVQPNSWVIGFFRDGDELQDPIITGVVSGGAGYELGIDQNYTIGYGDPHGGFSGRVFNTDVPGDANSFYNQDGPNALNQRYSSGFLNDIVGGAVNTPLGFEDDVPSVQLSGSVSNLISVAASQLPVRETSKNQGPGIAKYWVATSFPGGYSARQPWCAAFVSWCVKNSGIISSDLPNTARAFSFIDWARRKSFAEVRYSPRYIRAGDIIVYSFSHVGIATSDSYDATFATIEGNTDGRGSREGSGVWRRIRKLSLVRAAISLS